ncbi:hypothetical protein [Aquimarina aggregata]|uniref:hypothetical protein n=1 Tax=Aquimarina aggregata TaxID=1642818 RepID=UPI0024920537|nr:hypothetical protein [Aquimarina aggregata]
MKTKRLQQSILMTGVIILTTVTTHAQDINFSIKEVAEAFKRENECHYCTTVYQFSNKVQQISNIMHDLKDLETKKKHKKQKRLYKTLHAFIENTAIEHQGLADQLAFSKEEEMENTIISLIKLKGHTQRIVRLFERLPDLSQDESLLESKKRLTALNQSIGTTLTTLKKQ